MSGDCSSYAWTFDCQPCAIGAGRRMAIGQVRLERACVVLLRKQPKTLVTKSSSSTRHLIQTSRLMLVMARCRAPFKTRVPHSITRILTASLRRADRDNRMPLLGSFGALGRRRRFHWLVRSAKLTRHPAPKIAVAPLPATYHPLTKPFMQETAWKGNALRADDGKPIGAATCGRSAITPPARTVSW